MSFVKKTKEFFGLGPIGLEDGYYAEAEYEGNVAYAPRYEEHSSYDVAAPRYERAPEVPVARFAATIVPVSVRNMNDAPAIGHPFRDGDAVVFDMKSISHDEGKRIIDFAAGLCFALRGQMKKLDTGIFALIPEGSSVTTAELERAAGLR